MGEQISGLKPSVNGLIVTEVEKPKIFNENVSDKVCDDIQTAYLFLIEKYGEDAVLDLVQILEKSGVDKAVFHRNFVGGINGFLSYSQHVVLDRFIEALEKADDDSSVNLFYRNKIRKKAEHDRIERLPEVSEALEKAEIECCVKLHCGLRAFVSVDKHSKYNPFKNTDFDMALRTKFALRVFGRRYWDEIFRSFHPLIDTYLCGREIVWAEMSNELKIIAYSGFSEEFHEIIGLVTGYCLIKRPERAEKQAMIEQCVDMLLFNIRMRARITNTDKDWLTRLGCLSEA